MLSSTTKKDAPSECKPSIVQDPIGPHIIVTCANLSRKRYFLKLHKSNKPLPKCALISGSWFSPSEVESLAGKKSQEMETILATPYILSCSSVSLSQQSISANNANGDVVDNTGMLQSGSNRSYRSRARVIGQTLFVNVSVPSRRPS